MLRLRRGCRQRRVSGQPALSLRRHPNWLHRVYSSHRTGSRVCAASFTPTGICRGLPLLRRPIRAWISFGRGLLPRGFPKTIFRPAGRACSVLRSRNVPSLRSAATTATVSLSTMRRCWGTGPTTGFRPCRRKWMSRQAAPITSGSNSMTMCARRK